MSNSFFYGSPILFGDNTVPGSSLPKELEVLLPKIFQTCRDFGLDFYPTVVQMLSFDEMSEIASYGGFPVRYPHWKWGMEYEEMQRGYEAGLYRIFELVINTNPCYLYCLDSNTLLDNVTVIAHALGHNDFFKNNIYFSPTSQNMMNQLANHGIRIRKYIARWGKERVTSFLDHVLRLETLIDPAKAWAKKKVRDYDIYDKREYKHPKRLPIKEGHEYMEEWINTDEWIDRQKNKIREEDIANQLGISFKPTKDILGFMRDYAPLKIWQQDILAMIYDESIYFAPQRMTKVTNEGFASWTDHNIIAKLGLASLGQATHDAGIIEYAEHKTAVLGHKYSLNPYKLGYTFLEDIEDRWNKGRFGQEYEDCKDLKQKENWDLNLGLGKEKVFEVRKLYDDVSLIDEFFTPEFCHKYEFYRWKKRGTEYVVDEKDPNKIKKELIQRYTNGGLPEIHLVDANHRGKGELLLEHQWDGRILDAKYIYPVIQSLSYIWGNKVVLETKTKDEEPIVFIANSPEPDDTICCFLNEYNKD